MPIFLVALWARAVDARAALGVGLLACVVLTLPLCFAPLGRNLEADGLVGAAVADRPAPRHQFRTRQ